MNYTERTKLVDRLCGAIVMGLLVEGFYGLSDSAFTVFNYNYKTVSNVIYVIGGIVLAIALFMLIKAYREEKSELGIYGVELLVIAITAGLLPGTYLSYSYPFNKLNVILPLAFGVYYIAKALYVISRRNLSNSILLGIIEAIFIAIYTFGLFSLNKIFFMVMAVFTVAGFAYAAAKKSKFVLVHALEFMIVNFMVLLMKSAGNVITFGVIVAIYYILKSVFVTINYGALNGTKAKRRK
ncbi:MAG: hypothetical protein IJ215_04970 [Clostridia bacterium]|nr:hypothetical protein [Clostridia bacterium]